ncbi:rho GTPase-activating protein 18-like [Gordionus sp. m RMFG-2023]|uniref:rho GTPase-activating protein 18-like n=1 Tax=Gordionus sp. m RMFG-2023 TaxID=3053472 RepID=UPI0031FD1FDB
MCHYNDLSPEDLAGLQRLALIELTIIFDRHRLRVSHISAHKLKALRRKERQDRLKSSNKCHIESPCCYRDDQAERENQNNRDIYSVAEARLKQGGFNGGRPNNGTNQPPLAYSSIPADGGINNGTMFQSYFDNVGCCLEEIVAKERKFAPLTTVPSLFESMIRYLEQNGTKEEGIFRVPGSLHRIKSLIKAINDNRQIDFSQFFRLNNSAANDIAALLKMYLRELPEPLLTRKHVLNFSQISKISALEDRIKALNYLIILLPDVNNRTLRMLIRFLNRISLHQNQNKMTTDNIATIMAPNIFPEEVLSSFSDPSSMKVIASNHNNGKGDQVVQGRRRRRQLDQAMRSCNIIKSMLTYEHQLWMVPDELLNQHRLINDTKNRKNKRKNPSDYHAALTNKIFDFNQEMIDIEISIELMGQNFRKIITTPINHSTAIKDVVGNCKKFLNMDSWRRIGLFETGGNIGERYLNQNLVLVNVMKSNPTCNLVLKEIK